MPLYQYDIKTTHGEASGQIEATDEKDAEKKLTELYAPEDHGLVTKAGKPVKTLEVSHLELTEV